MELRGLIWLVYHSNIADIRNNIPGIFLFNSLFDLLMKEK